MKVSLLCGAHYEGAEAFLHPAPVSPAYCDPEIARQSFDHVIEFAALADELAYDWVSVSEHHYSPLILTPSVAPIAGALTQVVRHARIALLGPLAPLNNPIRVAEEIAVLDQLSRGRLLVLPLRGTPTEFNSYLPVEAAHTQPMTQEATLLIQKALSETEPFAWNGEYFQFPHVSVWPRTVQRPFPPMYFSANSVNSALFAAQHRLGMCMSFHRAEVVAQTVAQYRAEAARAGWDPTPDQIVYRGFALVADTETRAAELESIFLPPPLRFLLGGPTPAGAPSHRQEQAVNGPAPFGLGRMLLAGTPEVVVERIREFHATTGVGVLDLVVSAGQIPADDVRRTIELFGQEVLPRIRDLGEPATAQNRVSVAR